MFKKLLSLALCLAFIMTAFVNVSAIEEQEQFEEVIVPQYVYTVFTYTDLQITNNTAKCSAYLEASSSVTKIVVTMTLQKEGWLWWSTEETWSYITYTDYAYVNETYTVDSDTYRVKTTFTVYSGTDYETITVYSSEVEC